MFQLLLVVVFCTHGIHARGVFDNFDEEFDLWPSRGVPGTAKPQTTPRIPYKCIRDLLILWDNSRSVGKRPFEKEVKPFIEGLIRSQNLYVGEAGTHIGIITFANQIKTRLLWDVDRYPRQDELLEEVEKLQYGDLEGDGTRTGLALMMANDLFSQRNPGNYRENVKDVVFLITDGDPVIRRRKGETVYLGYTNETHLATHFANELKKKNVTIVGLATGRASTPQYEYLYKTIEGWSTSDKHMFKAEFSELQNILDELVIATCTDRGVCGCSLTVKENGYTAKGKKVAITWKTPTPNCPKSLKATMVESTISPDDAEPGDEFEEGEHKIVYTYTYMVGKTKKTLQCPVHIIVTACECPARQRIEKYLKPGETDISVSRKEPKPTCPLQLLARTYSDEKRFSAGKYTDTYEYTDGEGFSMSCYVDIIVQACECSKQEKIIKSIPPGEIKAFVQWSEPKPTCEATLSYSNYASPEGRFSVGQYTARYVYSHKDGFDLLCSVDIEVKGEFCRGKAFDPNKQECCCGEAYDQKPGYRCCGMEYYDANKAICCDEKRANLAPEGEKCPIKI